MSNKHCLAHWCYSSLGDDRLIGLHTLHGWDLELAPVSLWPALKQRGVLNVLSLILYGENGPPPFEIGFANSKHQDQVVDATEALVNLTADAGFPKVIAFTGYGEPDEAAQRTCIAGLKRVAPLCEERGVTMCLEHLNTRVADHPMKGHPGYCGRDFDWVLETVRQVGSPNVKILADAYHMQVMGGDLFRSYGNAGEYIGHVHVAGNPGRGKLNGQQEINFPHLARHIREIGYTGHIGQEWIPEPDCPEPMIVSDLEASIGLCTV